MQKQLTPFQYDKQEFLKALLEPVLTKGCHPCPTLSCLDFCLMFVDIQSLHLKRKKQLLAARIFFTTQLFFAEPCESQLRRERLSPSLDGSSKAFPAD
jgi:hypothetical protein